MPDFRNSSVQFFKPAWCSNFCELSDSLVNIYFYFSLLEAVLRECLIFVISPHVLFWPLIFLKL